MRAHRQAGVARLTAFSTSTTIEVTGTGRTGTILIPMADLLTRLDLRGASGDLRTLLPAPAAAPDGPVEAVRAILEQVRKDGDAALRELTERFDRVHVDDLRVPADGREGGAGGHPRRPPGRVRGRGRGDRRLPPHPAPPRHRAHHAGVVVRDRRQPVDRAGCYVPGGRAPLASTVLMTAVPARVAGVGEVALCSPPGPDGRVAAPILAAAAIAGVDEVYRVGGAQAIAALAYGTETHRARST